MSKEICFEKAQVFDEVGSFTMKTSFYYENSLRESFKQGGHV